MALTHMEVHLVSIEISVVTAADVHVQSKGRAFHDSCSVCHHTHLVQCWLTIEKHDIPVSHMSLDHIANFQYRLPCTKLKVYPVAIFRPDDKFRSRILGRVVYKSLQVIHVAFKDFFRKREIFRYGVWDANFFN